MKLEKGWYKLISLLSLHLTFGWKNTNTTVEEITSNYYCERLSTWEESREIFVTFCCKSRFQHSCFSIQIPKFPEVYSHFGENESRTFYRSKVRFPFEITSLRMRRKDIKQAFKGIIAIP